MKSSPINFLPTDMAENIHRHRITIFTDGSCNVRTGIGGYGVYLVAEHGEQVYQRGYTNTTTARMEMRALLQALRMIAVDVDTAVTLYSDSQFVVNAFRQGWIGKWRSMDYLGTANADLWRCIVRELSMHHRMKFSIKWCRGHQKNLNDPVIFGNNVADALADYRKFKRYHVDTRED